MTVLRDITNAKHRLVESLPLIQTIMQGKITHKMYVGYLYELLHIYQTLESLADRHHILDQLTGIHRTELIKKDLQELDPDYTKTLTASTIGYLNYLQLLSDTNPKMLLAHVYVRHMGDLYGGKLMARVVPGSGYAYQFDDRPGLIKVFNEVLTTDLGNEANIAFDAFIDIFQELYESLTSESI